MPSTIGLSQAGQEAKAGPQLIGLLAADEAGTLTLPAELLAQTGLNARDDLICEVGPAGLRLTSDALRKVYVEITSACNLTCATCIRNVWAEPLGHMPVARFKRLLAGLPEAGGAAHPITLSLSGSCARKRRRRNSAAVY